jgi:hypothetical protein
LRHSHSPGCVCVDQSGGTALRLMKVSEISALDFASY